MADFGGELGTAYAGQQSICIRKWLVWQIQSLVTMRHSWSRSSTSPGKADSLTCQKCDEPPWKKSSRAGIRSGIFGFEARRKGTPFFKMNRFRGVSPSIKAATMSPCFASRISMMTMSPSRMAAMRMESPRTFRAKVRAFLGRRILHLSPQLHLPIHRPDGAKKALSDNPFANSLMVATSTPRRRIWRSFQCRTRERPKSFMGANSRITTACSSSP